jgi:hypothetical protein
MKQPFRIALLFAALVLPLAVASAAHAGQSALVGKLKQDGTIQLYTNRFKNHFADGTPVAKIEAKRTDGTVRVERRSADGCLAEMTELEVNPIASADGSHPLWQATEDPLTIFRCQDNGCAEEFTEGAWTAACGDFGAVEPYIIKCICIRTNFDQVIGEGGDWCRRLFWVVIIWDLEDWILPQYIEE